MIWSDMCEFAWGEGRQRLPTRDRPDAKPSRLVVRDPWKVPPELNDGGQLAMRLVHLTDGRGCRFIDTEHGAYNGRSLRAGQAKPENSPPQPCRPKSRDPAGGLEPCRGHLPIRGASPEWR
jgi:hypothetical protein